MTIKLISETYQINNLMVFFAKLHAPKITTVEVNIYHMLASRIDPLSVVLGQTR